MQRPLARVLLILVVGILVYANSFHVPFILDDYLWIETNDVIRNPANFLPGGPGYAASPTRFVGLLSFALNYRFSGLELFGYHLVNLGIHLGCALLVYALLRLTLETPLLTAGKNGLV
ncbi:MAG: hypothetical protein P8X63_11020, partial [Desulfuromonadaceae bacterium]